MEEVRGYFSLNIDMPGSLEMEDPNRFVPDLRPVEEFRHTPLVPIDKRTIEEFENAKKIRNANPFVVNYTFDNFVNLGLFLTTGVILVYLIKIILDRDEEKMVDYFKSRNKRDFNQREFDF